MLGSEMSQFPRGHKCRVGVRVPTAETQILAQAARLATRKARGTMGRRQKLRIKGAHIAAVTVSASGAVATNDSQVIAPVVAPVVAAAPPGSVSDTPSRV